MRPPLKSLAFSRPPYETGRVWCPVLNYKGHYFTEQPAIGWDRIGPAHQFGQAMGYSRIVEWMNEAKDENQEPS